MKPKNNRDRLQNLLKVSNERQIKEAKAFSMGSMDVIIKDSLPEEFDLKKVLDKILDYVPSHLLEVAEIDLIYIGQFEQLEKKQFTATYESGAIYVTNEQDDEEDMVDDLVHEIAHAVEEKLGADIYGNGELEIEFLGKRKRLFQILRKEIDDDITNLAHYFMNVEYDVNFDEFLLKDVGYASLTYMSTGLFTDPYASTSLREYFATGFEEYFIRDRKYLQNISPVLYNIIRTIGEKNEL
tara:strand:- start:420 stop:1139 length:720 start_codon:yes stop_codon:yes gene_type:complete